MAENNRTECAYLLKVVNARLKFGNHEVLSGLNMTVPKGTMYTLLGSSGCGKTTLLNCIINTKNLDSGKIYRQWRSCSAIGYMPQEIALNPYLTIKELFRYFSKVHDCSDAELLKRMSELTKMLQLPPCNRVVGSLSGGEQRRVSLAVTVLHDPKFLILDEPTVGQDPLLRKSIWDFLMMMIENNNKTVLITTHYIQEATQANIVGMMRNGVMVAEETPQGLLQRFEVSSLEASFVKLSVLQTQEEELPSNSSPQDIVLEPLGTTENDNSIMESCSAVDEKVENSNLKSSRLLAEIHKNIYVLWRNKSVLAFQFLVPILVHLVWQTSIGVIPDGIKLGVINEELSVSSDQCLSEINSTFCSHYYGLSCYYTHKMESNFDLVPYDNINSGIEDVKTSRTWGLIHFSENYTQALLSRAFDTTFNTSDELIDSSQITVWLDSSSFIIYSYMQEKLSTTLTDLLDELFSFCHWGKPNFLPFAYNDPIYGSWDISHVDSTTPAYLIVFSMYFASTYPIAVLIEEKAASILKRVTVSGVTALEIILASFLINSLLSLVQIIENLVILFVFFRNYHKGSMINIFLFAYCSSIYGNLYGILTACLTKSAVVGILSSLALANGVTVLSGVVWPQEGQAPLLQYFKWLIPASYPAESLRSAMVRGKPFYDFSVYSGFLYLVGYNAIFCIIIRLILWRKNTFNV